MKILCTNSFESFYFDHKSIYKENSEDGVEVLKIQVSVRKNLVVQSHPLFDSNKAHGWNCPYLKNHWIILPPISMILY